MTGAIFLDRDGVINRKAPDGEYVEEWGQFEFMPGAIEALRHLTEHGRGPLVVVTNQRGIALGRTTQAAVDDIHRHMQAALAAEGAQISSIQVCPHDIGTCACRKPEVGLFLAAARHDPTIELARSAVVGDSLADLEAGRRLGAQTYAVSADPGSLVRRARSQGIEVSGAAESLLALVRTGALDRHVAATFA